MESAEKERLDVFAVVKGLQFPANQYLVFGSGILTALGIRESEDVDLLVVPDLFDKLKAAGWQSDIVEIEGRPRERISRDSVEAFKEYWCDGKDYDISELIKNATRIDSIPFMSLSDLLVLKRSMGREKDLKDIDLIEKYLRDHPGE